MTLLLSRKKRNKRLLKTLTISLLLSLSGCFNDTPYTKDIVFLTVNIDGQGDITIQDFRNPFICESAMRYCTLDYMRSEAENVSLTAKAYPGYSFKGWTGIEKSNKPELRLVMDYPDKGVEVTAIFVPE